MLAASKTLGQIAAIGGADFGEGFMDLEVPAAVDLLQGAEPPRYAGVLILKELARNSANYFHSHISLVFDKILIPLRDSRVMVREGAAELLAACLEIVANRERQTRTTYLMKILQDAQLGLRMAQPEVIHGSLLMYRELLLHGDTVSNESIVLGRRQTCDHWFVVYAGVIPRYSRADPPFQVTQGRSGAKNGYYTHTNSCSIRHPNIL